MKNLKTFGLLAVLALIGTAAQAQTGRHDNKFKQPVDANSVPTPTIELTGVAVDTASAAGTVSPNTIGTETTAKLWFAGEGVFYDVVASSGAAGEAVFCFDAATSSDVNPLTSAAISLVAYVQKIATATRRHAENAPLIPVKIRNGLVCDSTENAPYWPVFEKK